MKHFVNQAAIVLVATVIAAAAWYLSNNGILDSMVAFPAIAASCLTAAGALIMGEKNHESGDHSPDETPKMHTDKFVEDFTTDPAFRSHSINIHHRLDE